MSAQIYADGGPDPALIRVHEVVLVSFGNPGNDQVRAVRDGENLGLWTHSAEEEHRPCAF